MEKFQRNERISYLTKVLTESPCKIITLTSFMDALGAAKSTISEDIDVLRGVLKRFEMGSIESVSGASGGVVYVPGFGEERTCQILTGVLQELSQKERILPGGFLYMLDLIYNPLVMQNFGAIFASKFFSKRIDYVITVETKGIPLAYATARSLNVPLVIVRHNNEVTDGASVNINYISGSSKNIQTMVLSLKALKKNSRLLFVDDFMKGGGTAKAILELAKEFSSEVVGIGVLIDTEKPVKKLVDDYIALLTLKSVDQSNGVVDIILCKRSI